MDNYWRSQFAERMQRFGKENSDSHLPVSIKVRAMGGCFHREHSPEAYRMIDEKLSESALGSPDFCFEEHESGPELLIWAAVTTAGLTFAKSVIELITAILKARSEGKKKGDQPAEPLELIVRGHWKDGEYFEETILKIPLGNAPSVKEIESLLIERTPRPKKKRAKK